MSQQVTNTNTNQTTNFVKWGGAFAVYAVVILALSDSDSYGELGVTTAWLVAFGSFMYWYNDFDISLAQFIGQSPSTTGKAQ